MDIELLTTKQVKVIYQEDGYFDYPKLLELTLKTFKVNGQEFAVIPNANDYKLHPLLYTRSGVCFSFTDVMTFKYSKSHIEKRFIALLEHTPNLFKYLIALPGIAGCMNRIFETVQENRRKRRIIDSLKKQLPHLIVKPDLKYQTFTGRYGLDILALERSMVNRGLMKESESISTILKTLYGADLMRQVSEAL